jgi:hypothetical protein
MIGGWDVAAYTRAATRDASARDWHDFMILPDGRLMVALATVAENGVDGRGAALHLAATGRAALRVAARETPSAGHALSVCNDLLCPELGPESAVATLLALVDPASGRMQIANAGQPAALRWNGADLVELREGGALLGGSLGAVYDHDDLLIEPGESVLFYSAGALGARPETGEPFGPERVRRVLAALGGAGAEGRHPPRRHPPRRRVDTGDGGDDGSRPRGRVPAQAMVDALRMDLVEFAAGDSLSRLDITLIALARPAGPGADGTRPRRSLRDELRALGETDTDL